MRPSRPGFLALEHLRLASEHGLDARPALGQVLGAEHLFDRAADHLLARAAEPIAEMLVGVAAHPVAAPVHDAPGDVLGDRARELLGTRKFGIGLAQPDFGLLDRRDVGLHHEEAVDPAAVPVRHVVRPQMPRLAAHIGQRALHVVRLTVHQLPHQRLPGLEGLVAHQLARMHAHDLLAREAEPRCIGFVGELAHVVAPVRHHAGQVLGERLQKILARAQLFGALDHFFFELGAAHVEFGLELLAPRDLARDLRGAHHAARAVADRRDRGRHHHQVAILVAPRGLQVLDALAAPDALEQRTLFVLQVGRIDLQQRLADGLARGVAEQALGAAGSSS